MGTYGDGRPGCPAEPISAVPVLFRCEIEVKAPIESCMSGKLPRRSICVSSPNNLSVDVHYQDGNCSPK